MKSMYQRQTLVANPTGIHARTASDFIAMAKKFEAKIKIKRADDAEGKEEANAKSIVHLLGLGISQGEEVIITADGTDENEAVDGLIALIDSRFGE
jgi:phosphocarrier protein